MKNFRRTRRIFGRLTTWIDRLIIFLMSCVWLRLLTLCFPRRKKIKTPDMRHVARRLLIRRKSSSPKFMSWFSPALTKKALTNFAKSVEKFYRWWKFFRPKVFLNVFTNLISNLRWKFWRTILTLNVFWFLRRCKNSDSMNATRYKKFYNEFSLRLRSICLTRATKFWVANFKNSAKLYSRDNQNYL